LRVGNLTGDSESSHNTRFEGVEEGDWS
jgi:hypothetical protein